MVELSVNDDQKVILFKKTIDLAKRRYERNTKVRQAVIREVDGVKCKFRHKEWKAAIRNVKDLAKLPKEDIKKKKRIKRAQKH
jgi:hypothetical protein